MSSPEPLCGALAGFTLARFLVFYKLANRFPNHRTVRTYKPEYSVGVMTGIHQGYPDNTFLLTFLGTVTGVGGGLMRDVMAGVPPYIFVKHIYACASVLGALSCIFLYREAGELPAMILSSILVVVIRLLAAKFHWNLPRIHTSDLAKK